MSIDWHDDIPQRDQPGAWAHRAACRGRTHDMFPNSNSSRGLEHSDADAYAVAICRGCPVIDDCLEHALNNGETLGVWGGLTANERRPLTAKLRRCRWCHSTFTATSSAQRTCDADCSDAIRRHRNQQHMAVKRGAA